MDNQLTDYLVYSTLNKRAIEKSTECICISCFTKLKPIEITEYCHDKNKNGDWIKETAICPHCSIDAIVPNYLVNYNDTDIAYWHNESFRYN